jgi:hypothetical protein
MLDLDQAQGVWLDFLGNFVGELRAGANDADYRTFLQARIIANRSQGRIEDLIAVARKITALSTFGMVRMSPASLEMSLFGYAMAEPIRTRLMQLLRVQLGLPASA